MNDFFSSQGDVRFKVPKRAYARFEQPEPQDLDEANLDLRRLQK